MKVARSGTCAWLALLVACGPPEATNQPDPTPEDTDEDAPWEPPDNPDDDYELDDTGFPPLENLPPADVLYIAHEGSFTVSGDPVSALTGTLRVRERLNAPPPPLDEEDTGAPDTDLPDTGAPLEEEDPVGCDVTYTLSGALPDEPTGCGPCDYVLDVTFTVTEGDPGECRGPETPSDGGSWRFGYAPTEQRIFLNYHGVGVYLPWYEGVADGEAIALSWTAELGIEVEEE